MKTILPEEIVSVEILTRLPVKSLVRCMSVFKSWMDLIKNNPSFISMHLTTMKNKNTTTSSSSSYHVDHNSCGGVKVTTDDWFNYLSFGPQFPYDILKLNLDPSLPYTTPYSIIGYSDGIFCLSWNHLERYYGDRGSNMHKRIHRVIALCNPALRELRILPLSSTDFPPYRIQLCVDFGFGFDPTTNDYKVVKMVMFDQEEEGEEYISAALDCIEVYSMASDSWRMVSTRGNNSYPMACNLHPRGFGAIIGGGICTSTGVLHWDMANMEDSAIASFHMDDDSLRVTKLPSKYASYNGYTDSYISLLDDKLALICSYRDYEHDEMGIYSRIEIFLLMIDSSWSLARVLVDPLPNHIKPLGFWLTSWLLVYDCKDQKNPLVLYDTASKQYMDVHQLTSEMGFFYRESLVSVKRQRECEEGIIYP